MKIHAYIDSANLHRASNELGFDIDYKKFRGWLRQKYNIEKAYMFIGLIPSNAKLYEHLQRCGFILIFKETISVGVAIKGNCDAELVLNAVSDFYTKAFDKCLLITGDGDFACLAEFLQNKKVLVNVLAPSKDKCSFLLRNKYAVELMFLNDHYHKFSNKRGLTQKEKAPDADGSA